jgi:hypothetical protein
MALTINAPDNLSVVRETRVDGVSLSGVEGHVDIKISCQFGTLKMNLLAMPTACHINGNDTNTLTSGGQIEDVNDILTTLMYYYPECYQPDTIVFEATQGSGVASEKKIANFELAVVAQL